MKLHFLGANRQVTGSRYLLEAGGMQIMIDCGLFQERSCQHRNWDDPPVDPDKVDVMLLTHGHLDHCGLIPRFVSSGFRGRILTTPPSIELARIVLEDAARIQEEDASYKKRRHKKEKRKGAFQPGPLYTVDEARATFERFDPIPYDKTIKLNEHVSFCFHDAGHILGSAMIELHVDEGRGPKTIVFSGDLGQSHRVLMKDPTRIERADFLVMESTYGDRPHKDAGDLQGNFAKIINDTVQRGGNVVIPTFAIDRSQELMYHLSQLTYEKRIPSLTTFLDSPMAVSVTNVYKRHKFLLDEQTQAMLEGGRHPFQFDGLHFVRSSSESRAINTIRGTCIILAGSGMCTGGRVKHHLRQNIARPESTILFVGYQANGTLGRHILEGDERVRIHGRSYDVNARITKLNGLSAHGDRNDLLSWAEALKEPPNTIFLTHGEERAANRLAQTLADRHGWKVKVPRYEEVVDLDAAS